MIILNRLKEIIGIKNATDVRINPATEETSQAIDTSIGVSNGHLNTIKSYLLALYNSIYGVVHFINQSGILTLGTSYEYNNETLTSEKLNQYNCESFDITEDSDTDIVKRFGSHDTSDLNHIDISWFIEDAEAYAEISIFWWNAADSVYVRVAHEYIGRSEMRWWGNRSINIDIPLTGNWHDARFGYIKVAGLAAGKIHITILHYTHTIA